MKNKKQNSQQPIVKLEKATRFDSHKNKGLTTQQVAQRQKEGLVNFATEKKTKSIGQIIFSNIFTFFNLIYLSIATILTIFGLVQECFFMIVIVLNTAIAIFQQIRSKKTLDKLNFVTVPTATVVRDGQELSIPSTEVVLDDIIIYSTGNQISCDSVVLDGSVEVNESMLTGESDAVVKKKGTELFAGSFIVAGKCHARVNKVGKYNYVEGLSARAKVYEKPRSELLRSLKGILIFVGIIILPMLFFLWQSNAKANGFDWTQPTFGNPAFLTTLRLTAGSIISMVPVGPLLLTSIALAKSVVSLAKHKTLVQELYCIEMLARVNCLCLDKTGTLTDGTMKVVDVVDLRTTAEHYTLREIMGSFLSAQNDDNMTSRALKSHFGCPKQPVLKSTAMLAFSSQRKLSATTFGIHGTYILGAPEFILKTKDRRVDEFYKRFAKEGLRVLLLAHSPNAIFKNELPSVRKPVCIIVIEDHVRKEAPETIQWFKDHGVNVKIISGDNPQTVSAIAIRTGVEGADKYISLEGLTNLEVQKAALEYNVFGRVSPDQKALLVKTLRSKGKTVAMTGDGVNDILAMKEADCPIAMASGADAARNVSHLVLMDDNFASMPAVVREGRQVVNNIQNSTSMYYMKTWYIIFINLLLIVANFGFGMSLASPYTSNQILMLEMVVVGVSTFFLALQPNTDLLKGHFLPNLLRRCIPFSLTFIFMTVAVYLLKLTNVIEMDVASVGAVTELSTIVSIAYTFCGLWALYYLCKPFDKKWKTLLFVCISIVTVSGIGALYYAGQNELFGLSPIYSILNTEQTLLLIVIVMASWFVMAGLVYLTQKRNKPKKEVLK